MGKVRNLVLVMIRFYQRYFSLSTHWLTRGLGLTEMGCRFSPRCSEYTYQALERYGLIKGGWLGLKRVLRCHPWSKGGLDPVV